MSRVRTEVSYGRIHPHNELRHLPSFKRDVVLAMAGAILVLGGYFLSRPGFTEPNLVAPSALAKSFEPTPLQSKGKAESGELSTIGLALAYESPAGSVNRWRGDFKRIAPQESEARSLNALSQVNFPGGDPAAATPSLSSWRAGLPTGSKVEAIGEMQALADLGDARAQYELATKLLSGRESGRDTKAAVRWLEKAATQGFALAQLRLGILYGRGLGVNRDYALARKWFQAAAENGNALAMHNLAVLLTEGHGRQPDSASANVWFRKAADLGIRDSQYNLGINYMRGLGVEKDLVQSYAWFATAAAQGDAEARKKRKEISALLDPEELSAAKALADRLLQRQPQTEAID